MADIPRFFAQVQQVSVPRMKDFEYEQNRSIYETMKRAGEQINNTFFEIVAEGQMPFKQGDTSRRATTKTDAEVFKQYEISKGTTPESIQTVE